MGDPLNDSACRTINDDELATVQVGCVINDILAVIAEVEELVSALVESWIICGEGDTIEGRSIVETQRLEIGHTVQPLTGQVDTALANQFGKGP